MDWFRNLLSLAGGLSLFLFGMRILGDGLEKRAGGSLKKLLGKLTEKPLRGLLLGAGVTALIQSSSAVTVAVVGFVNSGILTLGQAVGVIMGANVGTTVTSWLLSLSRLEGNHPLLAFFRPEALPPLLALPGVILYLGSKKESRRDTGWILFGFAVLLTGMEAMSDAAEPLAELPAVHRAFSAVENPLLGFLAGTLLTAVLQSSSASVGVLQALSASGQLSVSAAIPIVIGQNVGTCVTTLLSSIGANRNARRAAVVHLLFNGFGAVIAGGGFFAVRAVFRVPYFSGAASSFDIALIHTAFNVAATVILFPFARLLERAAVGLIPGEEKKPLRAPMDERLLATPAVALAYCRRSVERMALEAVKNVRAGMALLNAFDAKKYAGLSENEAEIDGLEDEIGNDLVRVGNRNLSERDSMETTALLHLITDFERISDHAVNLAEAGKTFSDTENPLSGAARGELDVLCAAVDEILSLSLSALVEGDLTAAERVEPLEQTVDAVKGEIRLRHVGRLQNGECGMEAGVMLSDLLTDLERIADHCSNVAGILLAERNRTLRVHDLLRNARNAPSQRFLAYEREYFDKYRLAATE